MAAETTPPARTAPHLDAETAARRAAQIQVIADPTRLRALSVLASADAPSMGLEHLAAVVQVDASEMHAHLIELVQAGLVQVTPGIGSPGYGLTAEATLRFGRLIAFNGAPRPVAVPGPGVQHRAPDVIERIIGQLAYRFSAYFSTETVRRYVLESYALLHDRAAVTRFLPSLTNRFASERLSALATSQGLSLRGTPEVLFVCVQNSGRSQMAAAMLRDRLGRRVHVRTAGSRPVGSIPAEIVAILDEVGIPIVAEFPKPLTDEVVQAADYVITMGCGDACPIYPGRRYMDWPVPDPIGKTTEEIRAIRDRILDRVDSLADEIAGLTDR